MSGMLKLSLILVSLLSGGRGQGDEVTYTVWEEMPQGTFVGDVSRDSNISTALAGEDLTSIRYRILQGSAQGSYFSIGNTSGVLVTASVLDRENIDVCEFKRECRFSIYVALQSGQFFRTVTINIFLADINDQSPTFPHRSINVRILESVSVGTSYTIDSAEDLDAGENFSIQSYKLVPQNDTFALLVSQNLVGEDVLRIVVTSPLDREAQDFYQRRVIAMDGGRRPNTGEMLVNISIMDDNDNYPQFSQMGYNVNISEALSVDSEILTVHATDIDNGENGRVYYKLSPQQSAINRDIFKIDVNTGEITPSTSLSSFQGKTIRLLVQAFDGGSEPRVTPTFVNVNIIDTANDPPRLELSVINGVDSANVREHSSLGFAVAHLIVSDKDSGRNGEVDCSVLSSKFQLQRLKVNQYKVVVSSQLDREEKPRFNVTVVCQDGGRPPQSSSAIFTVSLLDINDHAPVFQKSRYIVNITENNVIGQVVTQAFAQDLDVGENGLLTYQIASSYPNINDLININPVTGMITAVDRLDREVVDVLNITITASDHGSPPLSTNATLLVNILDQNDNAPAFREAVYLFKLLENSDIDTNIGSVQASDPDLNGGGFVTYALVSNGQYVPFILTGTGIILSNDVFDREKRDEYSFDVEARDHGYPSLSNRVRVIIEITDENDNFPVIVFPNRKNMTTKVAFQSPPGTQVTAVRGHDDDNGLNAQLVYSMRHGVSKSPYPFSMEKTSGAIFINKHMRMEDVGSYVVYVSCVDKGNPPKPSPEEALEIMVYVGNGTSVVSGVTVSQNALIVIALLCLTVISAAIILTVLLRIRRRDRHKKTRTSEVTLQEFPQPSPPSYSQEEQDFKTFKPVQVEHGYSKGNGGTLTKEDNKHEMLLFKMQLAEQYKQREHEDIQKLESKEPLSVEETASEDKYDVTDQQMTRLAALKYQQALLRGSKKVPPSCHAPRLGPKGETITDDILSNSSGETNGTDSGRGCSEEDCQSQSRSSLPSETDDSGYLVVKLDFLREQKKSNTLNQARHPRLTNSPSSLNQTDNATLPTSFKGGTTNLNIDSEKMCNGGSKKKPYSVHFNQDSTKNPVPRPPLRTFSNPQHHQIASSGADLAFKRGPPGCNRDILNESVEDDNTTTSGSYTIDHDNHPEEMITFSGFGLKDVYV